MTRLPTLVLGHKRLVVLFWLTVTAAGLAVSPKVSTPLPRLRSAPVAPTGQFGLRVGDG